MARALAVLLLAVASIGLIAACDGGDDFLLDPGPEVTGTPPFLQRTPESTPEPTPQGSPIVEGGTPVSPFQATAQGSVNVRSEPSSQGGEDSITEKLGDGDTVTVIAEVTGEEVSGNDTWYQLEDGGFVWSGAVTKAQEQQESTQ